MSLVGNASSLWAANALWPGAAIVARLKDRVPDLREVLAIDELDPKTSQPRQLPAAVVLIDRLGVGGRNSMRTITAVEQDWLVVLAVRSARPEPDRNSAELGLLLPQVIDALQGWTPPGQPRAFDWRTGPKPSWGADISYFPLVFSIATVTA